VPEQVLSKNPGFGLLDWLFFIRVIIGFSIGVLAEIYLDLFYSDRQGRARLAVLRQNSVWPVFSMISSSCSPLVAVM
jgi:hypothetical protein